jgi:hypothetical protein
MLVSRDGSQRVQPFMNIALSNLPKNLRSQFKLNWKVLFKLLEDEALTNDVNYSALNSSDSEEAEFYKAYNRCVEILKKRVSYCFCNYRNDAFGHWSAAT